MNGYRVLLTATLFDNQAENIAKMNKDMPILFVSGDGDPVGNLGVGVREAYDRFVKSGIKDVSMHLFHGDRHEILNETDREQVRAYIMDWVEKHI